MKIRKILGGAVPGDSPPKRVPAPDLRQLPGWSHTETYHLHTDGVEYQVVYDGDARVEKFFADGQWKKVPPPQQALTAPETKAVMDHSTGEQVMLGGKFPLWMSEDQGDVVYYYRDHNTSIAVQRDGKGGWVHTDGTPAGGSEPERPPVSSSESVRKLWFLLLDWGPAVLLAGLLTALDAWPGHLGDRMPCLKPVYYLMAIMAVASFIGYFYGIIRMQPGMRRKFAFLFLASAMAYVLKPLFPIGFVQWVCSLNLM